MRRRRGLEDVAVDAVMAHPDRAKVMRDIAVAKALLAFDGLLLAAIVVMDFVKALL